MATPEMESKFGDVCDIHTLMMRDVLGKFSKIIIADGELVPQIIHSGKKSSWTHIKVKHMVFNVPERNRSFAHKSIVNNVNIGNW